MERLNGRKEKGAVTGTTTRKTMTRIRIRMKEAPIGTRKEGKRIKATSGTRNNISTAATMKMT